MYGGWNMYAIENSMELEESDALNTQLQASTQICTQLSPKSDRLRGRIALVDEFAMRQESTVALLGIHLRERTLCFADFSDLLAELAQNVTTPRAVIFSAGPASIALDPIADFIKQLVKMLEPKPIILLSDYEDIDQFIAAFRTGVRGYVLTSMEPEVIIQAIRMVLSGGIFFPATPWARAQLALRYRTNEPCLFTAGDPFGDFDPEETPEQNRLKMDDQLRHWPRRQLAVIALIIKGRANKQIAVALDMDESTVKSHVRQIMRKLGVTNRTQVALCGRKLGVFIDD